MGGIRPNKKTNRSVGKGKGLIMQDSVSVRVETRGLEKQKTKDSRKHEASTEFQGAKKERDFKDPLRKREDMRGGGRVSETRVAKSEESL